MRDEKNISTEYKKEKFSAKKDRYVDISKDTKRKLIIGSFVILCTVPVLFCLFLVVKMNGEERRLAADCGKLTLKAQLEQVAWYTEASTEEINHELIVLEQAAYNDLGKEDASDVEVLPEKVPVSTEVVSVSGSSNVKGQKNVYLTFDDGPSIYTDEILDILKANDVKATFFVVYTDDKSLWPMYRRIVDEGHTLAMHSYSHVYEEIYASEEAFEKDVTLIHDFLYEQTGVDCTYYRFPGGSSNNVSGVDIQDLMSYLYTDGITYYDWNSLSGDAIDVSLTPEQLNANVMEYVRGNTEDSMVLLHDLENNPATMEGLQSLIDTLKDEGYSIRPITEKTKPVQHILYEED